MPSRWLTLWVGCLLFSPTPAWSWGFFAHERINEMAVYLLPPGMQSLFRSQRLYLKKHATDPDKRRYAIKEEGSRHFIDLDRYGEYPFDCLPRKWERAVESYTEDSLQKHGIVPWWLERMMYRLTESFRKKDIPRILQNAAEIGHYLSDAHVPLHACSNHNGQFSGQKGIHGLWESRIPELLADDQWDLWIGKAELIDRPSEYFWSTVLESAQASDSVLRIEKELSARTDPSRKYAYEERKNKLIRQYSSTYTKQYDSLLGGMVERRMRLSIQGVANIWYTCWVMAGQPDLPTPQRSKPAAEYREMIRQLDRLWRMHPKDGSDHL